MAGDIILETRGLTKEFKGFVAVNGVDLKVKRGTIHALIGPNGAGKTTFFNLLTKFLPPTSGQILYNGVETTELATHQIAHLGIGYCPEERGIFSSLTAEENLLLPPEVQKGGLSVDEIYAMFPNLYERRGSQGTRLSGGEQQMLAMARILRTGARLLLLDEITEGLAPVIVQTLGRVIGQLKERGFTIVLVEQNFRFAAPLADRHYVMEHGRIAETFAAAELESKMGMLHEYLGV